MKKETFITLDYDYTDINGESYIRLWGRTKEGKRICVLDKTDSYFWLIPKPKADLEKYAEKVKKAHISHAGREATVLDVKIKEKSFLGEPIKALQVFVSNPKDIGVIKDIVKEFPETLDKKEADINYITRYIIDKEVIPMTWYTAEGNEFEEDQKNADAFLGCPKIPDFRHYDVDIILKAESIEKSKEQPEFHPKILAFDIETSEFEIGKGKILMLSLADKNFKKVITWKQFSGAPKEIEQVKNEEELIKKFKEIVKEYKPDFLVGYFSDAFDLPYLRMRADEYNIKMNLGLDGSNITFSHGALPTSSITGMIHIDLYKYINNIISATLQSETISLNDVAREIIGEEKLKIDLSGLIKEIKETEKSKSKKLSDAEMRKFALYNLQDSVLTAKLFDKLWINIAELSRIVQEPLSDVSRATYSNLVEHNILHNLKKFNEIAQSRPGYDEIGERKTRQKYTGAYVKEPVPGLYDNIAVFDFRSFYPNIIVSFNISWPTLRVEKEKDGHETPEFELDGKNKKFFFVKKLGFIPSILNEILEKRKQTKQELKKHRSPELEARDYALKTLSNATYGYFGFFGARYYSPECAASIAAIARHYIHSTIEQIEKAGFKVIYSDTDSVMLLNNRDQKETLELLKKINDKLSGTMELELENFYKRGIFVTKKTSESGAKKKYALLDNKGKIKIRGFESVRRDRCELAKETQDIVLKKVLEEGEAESALKYVKKVIEEVKSKKAPIEKLVIKTQLKKEIENYSSIGPHVVVAKHMRELGLPIREGALIEYVIAKGKGKLIRERAKLPDEVKQGDYDIDYYISHQIIPAIESIFGVFNISLEEISKKQTNLKDF